MNFILKLSAPSVLSFNQLKYEAIIIGVPLKILNYRTWFKGSKIRQQILFSFKGMWSIGRQIGPGKAQLGLV
jgi:hypothetical protein